MTTAQVVETSVTVNNNSRIQDYVHPDDQTQPTFEMTPGFKSFTDLIIANKSQSRHSHNSQLACAISLKFVMSAFTCIYLLKSKVVNWELLKMRCRTENSLRGLLFLCHNH